MSWHIRVTDVLALVNYEVDFPGLTTLELTITPSIDRADVRASLARLQLA
jgi:hypothetical protein